MPLEELWLCRECESNSGYGSTFYEFRCQILRIKMDEHYLTLDHQKAVVEFVRSLTLKQNMSEYDANYSMGVELIPQTKTKTSISWQQEAIMHLQDASETQNILEDGLGILQEDLKRLTASYDQFDLELSKTEQDIGKLKTSVEEREIPGAAVIRKQEEIMEEVPLIKQKYQESQELSYEGILIWKITNFKEKIGNCGRQESFVFSCLPMISVQISPDFTSS